MMMSEGVKLHGSPVEISECHRHQLPLFLKEQGMMRGAEVGVYKGDYSKVFAEAGLEHYAIDPWVAFPGQGRTQQVQERQNFIYGHAKRLLAPYENCQMIRCTSMEALRYFADRSLDYVYLDGDHSFKFIAEDIIEWSKKVRKGGVVAGHDYWNTQPGATNVQCHVKAVLDGYTSAFGITDWYIYGKMHPLEDQHKDDKYFSWMFFNV